MPYRRRFWALIGVEAAICLTLAAANGLRVETALISAIAVPIVACGAIGFFYTRVRPIAQLGIAGESLAVLLTMLVLGQMMTYGLAPLDMPFVDAKLAAADAALGFDWRSYAQMVDRHAWFGMILGVAYSSFNLQPIAIVLLLVAVKDDRRLVRFVLAMFMALMVTVATFAVAPAVSAYSHYGVAADQFMSLRPINTTQHVPILIGLRDGSLRHITGNALYGLATFPSFHACAGALFVWACWPIRLLRIPMTLLNSLLIAATPVHGAHYLIDGVVGIALAILAAGATEPLTRAGASRIPTSLRYA